MKLTRVLLVIGGVLTCFAGMAQITLKETEAPMEKVLANIEKQSRYVFLYDVDALNAIIITINVKNATLKETLERCFKDLPVEFTVIGNNVLLKKKRLIKEKKREWQVPG
jgi:hypothetical protein